MKNAEFYRRKWKEIHTNGARVIHGEISHSEFCHWVRGVPNTLPCPTCRRHAWEYIRRYPPEKQPNSFLWGWQFHNSVNERKKKPLMDYITAASRYQV